MIYTCRMAEPVRRTPSREGLREYLLVTAFLVLAVAGAAILFGDELRAAIGVRPAAVQDLQRP
jgi:hypothetical protein